MQQVRLTLAEGKKLAFDCLISNGCDEANAEATAKNMMLAEGDGCSSHGLFRLPSYVVSLRNSKIDGHAAPEMERLAPSIYRIDGKGGMAPLVHQTARKMIVECARDQGVAITAFVNIFHMAALWPDVEPLAEEGLAALSMTTSRSFVAPAYGSKPFFGTNPMAFAWPRSGRPPMVFDQAISVMARGEVQMAARDGHTLPEGVGLDGSGRPTNDPRTVLDGALLPFGGYKGSSIALMIDLLAGGLIGQPFSPEISAKSNNDGGPEPGGQLLIALDPQRFGNSVGWRDHCEVFFSEMTCHEGVRLPGSRRQSKRDRIVEEGFKIPENLHIEILELLRHPGVSDG